MLHQLDPFGNEPCIDLLVLRDNLARSLDSFVVEQLYSTRLRIVALVVASSLGLTALLVTAPR